MVYLLTDNILFSSKIVQNLKGHGVEVKTFISPDAMDATIGQDQPLAILINLNAQKYEPATVIRNLKAKGSPAALVAFCGHSDRETYAKGEEAGADRIVANSAITMNARQALRDAGVDV